MFRLDQHFSQAPGCLLRYKYAMWPYAIKMSPLRQIDPLVTYQEHVIGATPTPFYVR